MRMQSQPGSDAAAPQRWSRAHIAVEHEDLPALARLLADGAGVQDPDAYGFTLLNAPAAKTALSTTQGPGVAFISAGLQAPAAPAGFAGIVSAAARPMVTVHVAGHQYHARIHHPRALT
jgi:hypothetical protein